MELLCIILQKELLKNIFQIKIHIAILKFIFQRVKHATIICVGI